MAKEFLIFCVYLLLLFFNSTGIRAQTWEVADDCADACNLLGVAFVTYEKGVAVGDNGDIIYSEDGGITWKPAKVNVNTVGIVNLSDICFSDDKTGWIVGAEGPSRTTWLLKTTDSGISWVKQRTEEIGTDGSRIWFDDKGNGLILTYGGSNIYSTNDNGITWNKISLDPRVSGMHRGWHIFDEKHIIISEEEGLLAETEDIGKNWKIIETGFNDFTSSDVFFSDDKKNGWIVGDKGRILHTANYGKTWYEQKSGIKNYLDRVQFIDNNTGYIVGMAIYRQSACADYNGVLLYTEDGGENWTNINPTSATLRGLFFLEKHGWAVGGKGGSGSEPKVMILRGW